uniref:Uncharacterized protein n=1 Tax=Anguilla anguilla TaxID=7936 RepID=A0A0E9V294_ANGAN
MEQGEGRAAKQLHSHRVTETDTGRRSHITCMFTHMHTHTRTLTHRHTQK